MNAEKERKFNLAFNIFLVAGMLVALTLTTIFKLQQPGARIFMLVLAAFGAMMGILNTVLSANGHILTFVFGLVDVVIASIVLLDNGIMGNFALHAFYFLPMQFVGFWQWRKRGAALEGGAGGESGLRARRLSRRQWAWLAAGLLAGVAALYLILLFVDKAQLAQGRIDSVSKPKVLLDATVMALNIAGQALLSFAFMEQWYIWIAVDVVCTGLYLYKGICFTACLYLLYTIIAVFGYRKWKAMMTE